MTNGALSVRFWGVRGSVPVSGDEYRRFGGNTACIEVRCGARAILFDAGSGIRPAGAALHGEGMRDFDVLLTHCHLDHVVGLPFFFPLYCSTSHATIWSGHLAGRMTTREIVAGILQPPWFPIDPEGCRAALDYRDFKAGDVLHPRDGITVRTGKLNHPDGCIGYRLEFDGRSVAFISDTEHHPGELDGNVLELIRDADLVIYDSAYTDAEMEDHKGFGHSSWQQGVRLCKSAGAKRLALFHHDPARTDTAMEEIETAAKREFANAFAARDGMSVEL